MQRETKFNYGLLLAGIGLPFLMERLLGPAWGLGTAIVCCVGAGLLLLAGHSHREDGSQSPPRGRAAKGVTYGLVGALLAGGILGIILVVKRSPKVEQAKVEPANEPVTKPDTSLSSQPKSELVEQNKAAQPAVRPPSRHTSQRKQDEGSRTELKPKESEFDSFLRSLTPEELHGLGKNRLMALINARLAIEHWKIRMEERLSTATGEDKDFVIKQQEQGPPQKLKDDCKQAVAEYRAVRTLILEKSGPNEDTQEILKETGNAKCE